MRILFACRDLNPMYSEWEKCTREHFIGAGFFDVTKLALRFVLHL